MKDYQQVTNPDWNDIEYYQYLSKISEFPLLTPEEEKELAVKAKNGDKKAFDKLVNCNLRLSAAFAKKYCFSGMDVFDLIQSGNVGLIKAAQRYDPEMGYKFSTYAYSWIKRECLQFLAEMKHQISLNPNVFAEMHKLKQAIDDLNISGFVEVTAKDVEEISKATGISLDRTVKIINVGSPCLSIEENLEDNKNSFEEMIKDNTLESMEDVFIAGESSQNLLDTLSVLTEKEAEIIKRRFGLMGYPKMTLQEVGKEMNLSREGIRIKEVSALKKLRKEIERRHADVF